MNISSDDIFTAYLQDECPVCKDKNVNEVGSATSGGKTMAYYMTCFDCGTEYTVGFMRRRMPIESEITIMGKANK